MAHAEIVFRPAFASGPGLELVTMQARFLQLTTPSELEQRAEHNDSDQGIHG